MKTAIAMACGLFVVATVDPLSAAKPMPLDAPDPGRGLIGVRVKVIPPARIGSIYCDAVYFVRVEADADRFGAESLIDSNYTDGRDVYLLNAKPGRYVAVGCKLAPKAAPMGPAAPVAPGFSVGVSFSVPAAKVTFAKADILQTEVEVRAGGVAFMGQIEAHSSTKTDESDEAQAHYLQVISPAAAHQGSAARMFSGHVVYSAAFKSIERGPAEETAFWDESIDKRFTNELAWASRIAHRSSSLVVAAAGSTSTGATQATPPAATGETASNEEFLSAVCVEVNTVKARATGQAKEAPEIARLVCQTVMTDWRAQGCRENPGLDPCKKRLASFDGSLRSSGSSMLFAAARAGQTSICSTLLGMGSDPNAAMSTSWTPLMVAAHEGQVDVVRILVAAGANLNARNSDGSTALDLATKAGKENVVEALRTVAADGR
jgi:Ankyrin repeats (3 copies)